MYDQQFAGFVGIETFCRNCDETFPSKSKLHKHLRKGCTNEDSSACKSVLPAKELLANLGESESYSTIVEIPRVIKSTASTSKQDSNFNFRSWNYVIAKVRLIKTDTNDNVYLNTNCDITLIDRLWLANLLPNTRISKITSFLRVRGVGSSQHKTSKYLVTPCYFPRIDKHENEVLAYARREIHIVDELRANILIENDFINPKGISIDIANQKTYIGSYKTSITITAHQRGQYIRRKI